MHNQESSDKDSNSTNSLLAEDRYYVQFLTPQVSLVRERVSTDQGSGLGDRLVRSFELRQDAYMYASTLNDAQRKLDERYGHWVQNAI